MASVADHPQSGKHKSENQSPMQRALVASVPLRCLAQQHVPATAQPRQLTEFVAPPHSQSTHMHSFLRVDQSPPKIDEMVRVLVIKHLLAVRWH
jgi:hypothetical protein